MANTRKVSKQELKQTRQKQIPYKKPATNESRVFNIRMLQDRWDLCLEDVMAILEKHRPIIFGFKSTINYDNTVDEENIMVHEEDILLIEKKDNIPHKKIKPKKIVVPNLN